MRSTSDIMSPSKGDDRCKIFLSNLGGQINTEDLNEFFSPFGTIEHIESWTHRSAVILYEDLHSVDCVLAEHRKCVINNQEIYIRRIHYGYVERAYMDSTVLYIRSSLPDISVHWTEHTIRHCFNEYEDSIEQIRISSKGAQAWIYFKDYDVVDRILLQPSLFRVDGVSIDVKRAKCREKRQHDDHREVIDRLLEKNKVLRKQMKRKFRKWKDPSSSCQSVNSFLGQEHDAREEIQSLRYRISHLKTELAHVKDRSRYSSTSY